MLVLKNTYLMFAAIFFYLFERQIEFDKISSTLAKSGMNKRTRLAFWDKF